MIVVDAANVIGARPDGWWRDRAGAAHRFTEQVRATVRAGRLEPPVTLVLEGQARRGADEDLGVLLDEIAASPGLSGSDRQQLLKLRESVILRQTEARRRAGELCQSLARRVRRRDGRSTVEQSSDGTVLLRTSLARPWAVGDNR